MTREEAIQWLKHINITDFGWDDYAMQDSQKEIRERCEQSIREAIDMATEALSQVQCNDCKWNDDVIEVVRCKDCRHGWYDDDIEYYTCRHPKGLNEELYGVDFCSWGERKGGDTE